MTTFRINDFLTVEGTSLGVDFANRLVTGFSRVTIRGGGTTLELDASPRVSEAPAAMPKVSTLSWGKDDATKIDGGIELTQGKDAFVEFHWPNPLTPLSAGLFFRMMVERAPAGYRLRFRESDPAQRQGFAFIKDTTGFKGFFLGKAGGPDLDLLTPAEWRELWNGRQVSEASAESIREGALFTGEASRLFANEPEGSDWVFGWGFVKGVSAFRPAAGVRYRGEDFAVNARALRLEERDALLPRPLRWRRELNLRCASIRTDTNAPRSWAVDWLEVPTFDKNAEKDHLSLRAFWQELARHWPLGLRALRSRNALTFVPTDLTATTDAAPWLFRFLCRETATGFETKLATITSPLRPALRIELGLLLDTAGKPYLFDAPVVPVRKEAKFEEIVDVTEAGLRELLHLQIGSGGAARTFLVGGIVLDTKSVTEGTLRIGWAGVRMQLGQPPIAVDLDLQFAGGAPRPGTEDPERGFESENDLLGRERPLVIDLGEPAKIDTAIHVAEDANGERSRVLEVLVRNQTKDAKAGAADVVVIDPAPMLVARVQSPATSVNDGAILASYRDDGERPPGWEILTTTGAMTLVLPPQAIGEEMIKGNLSVGGTKVPDKERPFDFRLSPPARLELDRTDVDTARAPVPWSLRRLLDRREGVVGLKLKRARFELLYGMRTRIEEIEGLRIGEQDAFVGRIPIAPAWRDRATERDAKSGRFREEDVLYARKAVQWIRGLFRRPAQLPLFRDFAKRERLLVREGTAFDFRETRQTANPFRLSQAAASLKEPAADFTDRQPLRGGVDYPFESENIYGAVLSNEQKASAGQAQGRVAGLVFGGLGGSGSQHAAFDEGRSIIISETAQGRLSSLTLIRIGRIAMLWHPARHVIVYERTTRTAPRYAADQPQEFEGLAALRKVKEYVEITQPRRGYPDFIAGVEERPAAGPVAGCTFETVVIPVKSSWGHDIEDGWVIALRGPLDPHEEIFYPFPKIFLELARAEAKGAGTINHLVKDPSRLYFFTSTRKGLGADTDAWPAWPDVDFPLTPKPSAPQVTFLPRFSGANRQPDAAEHDFGQRRFTVDVELPQEAANLMHGRMGEGLEARVRNVSLLRGGAKARAQSVVQAAVGNAFADAEARIGDTVAELAQHFERLAQRDGDAHPGDVAGFREQALALLAEAKGAAQQVLDAVRASDSVIAQRVEGWSNVQSRRASDSAKNSAAVLENFGGMLKKELDAAAQRLDSGVSKPEELRVPLLALHDSICRQVLERADNSPFLVADVLERLRAELQRATDDLVRLFDDAQRAWDAEVDAVIERLVAESPDVLRGELFATVLDQRARVVAFANTFGRLIQDRLGPLFGDIPGGVGAIAQLTAVVDRIATDVTEAIDATLDVIPPFDIVAPDKKQLKLLLASMLPDLEAPFAGLGPKLLDPLKKDVNEWLQQFLPKRAEIEKTCKNLIGDLEGALATSAKLRDLASKVEEKWTKPFTKTLDDIREQAKNRVDDLAKTQLGKDIAGTLDRVKVLETELRDVIDGITKKLDDPSKTLRALADEAKGEAQRAAAGLRRVGEDIEQAVTNELRGAVEGAKSAALVLTRALAEGPVTDTLRCTRDFVGYYYEQVQEALDVTRAAAVFNDLGGGVLNGLSAQVPFDRIRDRLLPQLADFDLNKLFPDFAGLKLEHLLGGVKIPAAGDEYDWIRMRHGFDRERLTAWSEIAIDKQFDEAPDLFTLPPIALSVVRPRFTATSRIEADANGVRAQRTNGQLVADWTVTLNGQLIMSIEQGGLYFDSDGGFRFDFESNNLQLAPALQFVTDAMRELLPSDDGLTLTPILPGGISVELSVPLPDIGTGAFTLTGVTLYTHFDLLVANGFEVRTGLWLSRPERPFGLAVLFLGGGGWFGVDVRYKPPQEFETRVSLGLAAGAFVALNFGVARGSAGVLFTVGLDFYRNWLQDGTQDLAISFGILVWGEFSILSIVSAYLRVVMRIEYRNGEMTGYGNVSVSIKICWCFTLRVNSPIRLPFKSSKQSSGKKVKAQAEAPELAAPLNEVEKKSATVQQAVTAYFRNLAV